MKPFKRTVEKVLSWIANVFLILFTGALWYMHSRGITDIGIWSFC